MKNIVHKKSVVIVVILCLFFVKCHDDLKEEPFAQFAPEVILTSEKGLSSVLTAAYGESQFQMFAGATINYLGEGPTDIFLQTGGGQNINAQPLLDFTWDSQHPWIGNMWYKSYRAIRDANLFLNNVEGVEFVENNKNELLGEAKFLRAFAYYQLYGWFGPVPIVTGEEEDLFLARATEEDMRTFIETELKEAAELLPPTQAEYGRATKGAALAALTKYYLNTRQWEKTAGTAKQVMDLGIYDLVEDYASIFTVENEGNKENIYVHPATRISGFGNTWMALSRPPNYPITSNQANFAAQFRYYDSFVNTFDPEDERRALFLTEYTTNQGKEVVLLGNDNSRSFKFNDENSNGANQGNDFVLIRFADILLARAEALYHLEGLTQEVLGLINRVRKRADVEVVTISDFGDISFSDFLLEERTREFYSESKRREDLLRHDKFIEQAVARGKNAEPYHKLYPIPQSEIDANPNLEQNPGY